MGEDGAEQPELSKHDLKELKKQEKLGQRQEQSQSALSEGKKKRTKSYAITAVVVVLILGGLWFWSKGGVTGAVTIEPGDHPTVGSIDAPVSIIIFGDFQCPYTRKFWNNAFPELLENYQNDVRITYWPVPTAKHNYDRQSAEAAYCAGEQDKYWEYAQILFDRQGAAAPGNLNSYAKELGLDAEAFWECYSSGKYKDKVQEDYVQGRKFGVVQTPTLTINEHVLSGELPFSDYKTFIDYELEQV